MEDETLIQYRLKAHSLLTSEATSTALIEPTWDIITIEYESNILIKKGLIRLKKLQSTFELSLLHIIKKWRRIRKAERVSAELDSLINKLNSISNEMYTYLTILYDEKSIVLNLSHTTMIRIQNTIIKYESKLDFYDDLNNDCRQINFDIRHASNDLLSSFAFITEVLGQTNKKLHKVPSM